MQLYNHIFVFKIDHLSKLKFGYYDRLKDLLRTRLTDSGWREQLKAHCKEIVRQKGLENVTVDDLVLEVTPYARCILSIFCVKLLVIEFLVHKLYINYK